MHDPDDLEALVHDLPVLSEMEGAVAVDGEVVEEHVGAPSEVEGVAGDDIPGHAPLPVVGETIDHHPVGGAVGEVDGHEVHHQVVGPFDPGDRADPVHEVLGKVVGEIDVLGVFGGDPEVGLADGENGVGGVADQPLEEPHLYKDQHDGEGHAEGSEGKPQPVVQQHLHRQIDLHASSLLRGYSS